jgi:hypothetical protein
MRAGITVGLVILCFLLLRTVFDGTGNATSSSRYSSRAMRSSSALSDTEHYQPGLRDFTFQSDLHNIISCPLERYGAPPEVLFDEGAVKVSLTVSPRVNNLSDRCLTPAKASSGACVPMLVPALHGCFHFSELNGCGYAKAVPALTGCGAGGRVVV